MDDLAFDAEIFKHAFQKSGILLQRFLRHDFADAFRRLLQQRVGRELVA